MKRILSVLALLSICFVAGAANEVGTYPTAGPLSGSERMLADQSGVTVDILPSQITSYLQTSGGIFSLLPSPLVNGYCLANNGSALQWIPCSATGTVTSVGLSMPAGFTVSGSPITSNGAFTVSTSLTGVLKGSSGGFTTAGASDIIGLFSGCSGTDYLGADGACHSGSSSGTVTSVGLSVPSWLTASGSPVTTAGSISIAGATGLTTHEVIGTGTTGTLGLQTLSAADLPGTITSNTSGNAATATALAALPSQCSAGSFATGVATSGNANCSTAVTSVGLTVPSVLSVTGSPVTGSSSLAIAFAGGQPQAEFLATPTGSSGAVGLRAIAAADLPGTITSNTSGNSATATALAALPAQCPGGEFSTGIAVSGNANCTTPAGGGNVSTSGTPSAFQIAAWASGTTIGGISMGPGQVLVGASGANPTATSSPTLGASGTAGSIALGNATSGTVTLQTVPGALGAAVASLPANTGTLAETNLAQTFSALQTFGTNISIGGVTPTGATGTGNAVFSAGASLTTPNIGAATGTSLSVSGQVTSTVATGTAPLVVSSTTAVANLNASLLGGATFASPGPIGSGTPGSGAFTTLSSSGAITNTKAGAVSAPSFSMTGAPFTGGTGTTTVPFAYLNSGTAPTTFSTSGTEFGINAPSAFAGNFLDFRVNGGACVFCVSSAGGLTLGTPLTFANGGIGTSAAPSNGQVPIGNGSGFSLATITAGANITITNSAGGITIAAPGGSGVTSVSAGGSGDLNITPTTGAVVADLSTQAAGTVLANVTGSTAVPVAVSMANLQAAMVSANALTISVTAPTGPTNDWSPAGFGTTVAVIYTTPTAGGSTVDGLVAGSEKQQIFIVNTETNGVGTDNIVLKNQSSSDTTAANRFSTPGDLTVVPGGAADCLYLGSTISRWQCVAINNSSGGGGSGTVNSGTAGQLGFYSTTGTAISGAASASISAGALTLGASGTLGSVTMGNATSGTVTLAPVTGALGAVTASFPANTGTVAELNLAQIFNSTQTFSGRIISSLTPAVSQGAIQLTGSPFTGGTGTTTLPLIYANSGATAPTTFSTSGTFFGLNAPSGFAGNFLDFYANGTNVASLTAAGALTVASCTGCGSGSPAFNTVTAGTNANALVVGTGGSLTTSGTGSINATKINGITQGVTTLTSGTSGTPDCTFSINKVVVSTGTAFTINAPATCTPVDGQNLRFEITSSASGPATYTWNAIFVASATLALPTAANATSKEDEFSFEYSTSRTKWKLLAVNQGF